jgi:hypothetical protein
VSQGPSPQATASGFGPYRQLLDTLSATVAPLQALHRQAVEALAPTVQDILSSGSLDAPWIERTLDQLLNHACTPEGLTLFKALCSHYWQLDPQATASYINAYRDMWDGDDQNGTAQVEP